MADNCSKKKMLTLTLLGLTGCVMDLAPPEGAQIACSKPSDCPGSWICNSQTGLCARPSGDLTPPEITDVELTRTVVRDGGDARLIVAVSEEVTDRSQATILWSGAATDPEQLVLVGHTVGKVEFDFTADAARHPEGTATIYVEVWDRAGNPSGKTLAGTLVTDFTAPSVFSSSVSISYIDTQAPIYPVTGARAGTTLRVSFVATEQLATDPVVSTSGFPAFSVDEQQGTTYMMSAEGVGSLSDGDHPMSVILEDLAGNNPEVTLGTLRVRATTPSTPDVTTPGSIVYVRAPWGTSSDTDAVFGLLGAANAVVGDATVIARTSENPASLELGRDLADSSGGFDLKLIASNVDFVYVTAVDAAGNASAPAAVRDVRWTGTLRHKIAGSTTENPHDLFPSRPARTPSKFGDLAPLADAEYEDLFEVDGAIVGAQANFQWRQRRPPAAALGRIFTAAAYDDARGVAVLFGGWNFDGIHGDTWQWDGSAWEQATPTFSPPPRAFHAMTYDAGRSRVLLYGGTSVANNLEGLWGFDGVTWRHLDAAAETTPGPRIFHHLAYDAVHDEVILYGGCDTLTCDPRLNDTWIWNGRQWRDAQAGVPSGARTRATMGWDPKVNRIRLYGGCLAGDIDDCTEPVSDVYLWDGSVWYVDTSITTSPAVRLSANWIFDAEDDRLLMLSGVCLVDNGSGGLREEPCTDTWSWDASLPGWVEVLSSQGMDPPAELTVAFYDRSLGLPVEALGTDASQDLMYTNTWTLEGDAYALQLGGDTFARVGRRGQRAIFDGSVVLVQGGRTKTDTDTCDLDDSIHCGRILTWDGAQWHQIPYETDQGATLPPHRSHHAMVYDATLGRTVIFGGERFASATSPDPATLHNDLFAWNGSTWSDLCRTVQCIASRPSPREGSAMALDPTDGSLLVFGGGTAALSEIAETWRFNGTQWNLVCDGQQGCSSPTARNHAGLAYDEARGVFVLQGGSGSGSGACPADGGCNDTWEWTGSDWALVCDPTDGCVAPGVGEHVDLVYDSVRKRIVAFIGDQVWTWDGQLWRNISPLSGLPQIRTDAGLAYDWVRNKLVLFGGDVYDSAWADLWEMDLSPDSKASLSGFFQLPTAYPVGDAKDVDLKTWFGATGYDLDKELGSDNDLVGEPVPGGLVEIWSTAATTWVPGSTSEAGASSTPQATSTVSSAESGSDWIVGSDHTIHYRLVPIAGAGNGPEPAAVVADFVELTVDFRLSGP
ncbi:MAG: hypothetical protein A2289_22015 [Deltaproteobacteria bacterium RIFOXYA12_FULL_58_15]|nr:MAG: hypothetical protein A2289_22015 [Deltaproteobacteria bacterium RIFOXYA12_FULL_58_15]OGR08355.1 MAG: hypothetical protein A2341_25145 [Deltaproteobacteria bacterium RIFOXYB12_FULL_58_9]